MKHTTSITISTKKNETQETRWLVYQEHPFPRVNGAAGRMEWDNFGGLFKSYGQPATGIGHNYYCHLITPDADVSKGHDRTMYAGYNLDATNPEVLTPGGIIIRGQNLGATEVYFQGFTGQSDYVRVRVRGNQHPSATEAAIFGQQIVPKLKVYIAAHQESLFEEAKAALTARFALELQETREELDKLQEKAHEALKTLKP